jgi:predicted alpha/beta hydrolase
MIAMNDNDENDSTSPPKLRAFAKKDIDAAMDLLEDIEGEEAKAFFSSSAGQMPRILGEAQQRADGDET